MKNALYQKYMVYALRNKCEDREHHEQDECNVKHGNGAQISGEIDVQSKHAAILTASACIVSLDLKTSTRPCCKRAVSCRCFEAMGMRSQHDKAITIQIIAAKTNRLGLDTWVRCIDEGFRLPFDIIMHTYKIEQREWNAGHTTLTR